MKKQVLYLEVQYKIRSGKREEFLQKINDAGIAEASRNEEGNIRYDYFFDMEDPNELVLLETWETEEHQKKHTETEHFKLLSEIKKDYVIDTQIKRVESIRC